MRPQGLLCPGANNWGDWIPRSATRQAERLSPAAGGTHLVHMYIYTLVDLHTAQPRKRNNEAVGTVCV